MKKVMKIALLSILILGIESCISNTMPTSFPQRGPSYSNTSADQTEREYQNLIKTYKPETAAVLNDLLNDSGSNSTETSVTVENLSKCNMVLTISGTNFLKKIPIGAGKIGYSMVPKNKQYTLSGRLCNSVYNQTKYITSNYSVKLSN